MIHYALLAPYTHVSSEKRAMIEAKIKICYRLFAPQPHSYWITKKSPKEPWWFCNDDCKGLDML